MEVHNPLTRQYHHVLGLETFRTARHGEFYRVTFNERLETSSLYCGMVDEDASPGCATYESMALVIVKPLYRALFFHRSLNI